MGLLIDFDKLHISLKSSIANILSLFLFFFISVYLFKHELISKIGKDLFLNFDFYFLICICLCFSIIWFILNLIESTIAVRLSNLKNGYTDINSETNERYIAAMLYSIIQLSIFIFIFYH